MSIRPNSDLVIAAWVRAACGLPTNGVATTLPDQPWPGDQFVQIMQVGGTPNPESPLRRPVATLNCYAVKPNSLKPPWGRANALAEQIWEATFVTRYHDDPACTLTMPTGYGAARVLDVIALTEPRRLPADPSQYALYGLDIQVDWAPVDLVVAAQ